MARPPVDEAGPARQFQRQPLQVILPTRWRDFQAAEDGDHRVHRLLRQFGQRLPPAGQAVQREGKIAAGAALPGGVKPVCAIRGVPSGQALVELGGAEADQDRADGIQQIHPGQRQQYATQAVSLAQGSQHGRQFLLRLGAQQRVDAGIDGASRQIAGPGVEFGEDGLGLLQGNVGQFCRVRAAMLQAEHAQAGVPQLPHGLLFGGGLRQCCAPGWREVGLEAPQGVHFLHLPVELARF